MADFLAEKRAEIDARLDELRPHVAEHDRLSQAVVALEGIPAAREQHRSNGGATTVKSPRPHTSARRPRATGAGRKKGSGKRARQAVALLTEFGPQTLHALAERMGIKPNYLYRVLPGLEADGKVKKGDGGLYSVIFDA